MEATYARLKAGWEAGDRTRDHSLQLLFLAWMHWADPPHITGLNDDPDAPSLWCAIFNDLGGEDSEDAEFLFTTGLMAGLFPWGLGDHQLWEKRAARLSARAILLRPEGVSPEDFEGRGDYGEYFAHQARSSTSR
jgi:hypothetical protein